MPKIQHSCKSNGCCVPVKRPDKMNAKMTMVSTSLSLVLILGGFCRQIKLCEEFKPKHYNVCHLQLLTALWAMVVHHGCHPQNW